MSRRTTVRSTRSVCRMYASKIDWLNKLGRRHLSFGNRLRMGSSAALMSALLAVAHGVGAQELPNAPGKDMVVKLCSGCHEPTIVLTADLSVNGWPGEI